MLRLEGSGFCYAFAGWEDQVPYALQSIFLREAMEASRDRKVRRLVTILWAAGASLS